MLDKEALTSRLQELRQEHRDLDAAIDALQTSTRFDQLQLQRLKKKKLKYAPPKKKSDVSIDAKQSGHHDNGNLKEIHLSMP